MSRKKPKEISDYIYIRLPADTKKRIQEYAKSEGSNVTIWVRQLIIRELRIKEVL